MADKEVKVYKDFPRNVNRDSITVDSGYELQAGPLIADLAEAMKKVPEEYRENAGIVYPDEYGDEWGINWWYYESDADYEARYAKHMARNVQLHDKFITDYVAAKGKLMKAGTMETKRSAVAELDRLDRYAREKQWEPPK